MSNLANLKAEKSTEERVKELKECQEQEKATDEEIQAFRTHKLPPSGKCLAACVYEKAGGVSQLVFVLFVTIHLRLFFEHNIYSRMQIKDGKIDSDTIKANFSKEKGDNEKFNKAVDTCQSITNSDRCELAFQFLECMKKSNAQDSENSK